MWEHIHEYTRTMRSGYTIHSNKAYYILRKVMRLYKKYINDKDIIEKISDEIELFQKTISDILHSRLYTMNIVDFYLTDDDRNEVENTDLTVNYTYEPSSIIISQETKSTIKNAILSLDAQERRIVTEHIGLCVDSMNLTLEKATFEELATLCELSSSASAEKIFHKAIDKIRNNIK